MTREEHLQWCKKRALEYLPDDPNQAVASMVSDLGKHPDFRGEVYTLLALDGAMFQAPKGAEAVRRWINGFN